ncbi:MAG: hypothetical protein AB1650_05120 [Candidatus Omnitrophota bacterium]
MKRFCYVCEFVHKDPENPQKTANVERHIFIFVFRKKKRGRDAPKNRLTQWWNPLTPETPDLEREE